MEKRSAAAVYSQLDSLNIPYDFVVHEPVQTMEDCKKIDEQLGAPFCKNLFLQNRQGTEYFLLLVSENKRFRTAEVSKKINRARLSFGNEEMLYDLLGLSPGAISPMGLIHDTQQKVILLMDSDLLKHEKLCVHPCVNTQSLVLKTQDFLGKFLPHTGHKPVFIEIEENEQ